MKGVCFICFDCGKLWIYPSDNADGHYCSCGGALLPKGECGIDLALFDESYVQEVKVLKHAIEGNLDCEFMFADEHVCDVFIEKQNESSGKIFYLCDGKACENCNSIAGGECKHTCDISHAKNFEFDGYSFFEEEIPPIK